MLIRVSYGEMDIIGLGVICIFHAERIGVCFGYVKVALLGSEARNFRFV